MRSKLVKTYLVTGAAGFIGVNFTVESHVDRITLGLRVFLEINI